MATDALESTLLRPGIHESKIINKASLRLARSTLARLDLSGAAEGKKRKRRKKTRCSLLKKFDVAFKDVVISLVISPSFPRNVSTHGTERGFHGIIPG